MLKVLMKPKTTTNRVFKEVPDIIITRFNKVTTYDEEGNEITKRIPERINLTKKVNETKKLIVNNTAQKKLEEIEKIFTREK